MANRCSIEIIIPLDKVPDSKEREQLTALYKAEKKWSEAVKTNDELRRGKNYHEFIALQPGVPHKKTQWSNFGGSFRGRAGEVLKPDTEQWETPTIHASFHERDGAVWVHPYDFDRGEGLLFDNANGITFERPEDYPYSPHLAMRWDFKWSFPWWAEIGFAGGKKICNEDGMDAPSGQSDDFYRKWYDEHGEPFPFLMWEIPVSQLLKNLEYAINVYELFPLMGEAWQMVWVWEELKALKDLYMWMRKVNFVCPDAIGQLDWSEVSLYSGEYKWTQENDSPNQIMESVKKMDSDVQKLKAGELSSEAFKKKYFLHKKRNEEDYSGYIPVIKRNPFKDNKWL